MSWEAKRIGEPMPEGGNSLQRRRSGPPLTWSPEQALQLLEQGLSVPQIAKQLRIDSSNIYRHMLNSENIDKYVELQSAKSLAMLDNAEEEVETASDPHSLARGRERARLAQWRLERLMRRLYGQDQPVAAPPVAIYLNLQGQSVKTIEQDAHGAVADPKDIK